MAPARFWGKSLVGDFDTPTDWIFLTEVHNHHLYYLVLASCIIATLLYMYQASGGFFGLLEKKLEKCYKKKEEQQQEEEEKKKKTFGSIFWFTLFCIVVEDVVQLVLTLVVTEGNFDSKAQLNILGSIFSIIIKVGEAEFSAGAEWVHTDLQGIRRDVADFERKIQNEETAKTLSTQEKKERPVLNKLYECLAGEDLSAQAQSWKNWCSVLPIYTWEGVEINPDTGEVISLNMKDQLKPITAPIISTASSTNKGRIGRVCELPATLEQCTAHVYTYNMRALLN